MGVYLSTPVTDKVSSDNKCKSFTYGESSMQGWRQTQEDAHNCSPDFDPDTDTSLFAVYDGHGGAEVAQYCAVHLPAFIKETAAYKAGNLIGALEDAFLGFDELLTRDDVMKELKILAGVEDLYDNTNAEEVAASRAEAEMLQKEAKMPLDELLANYDRQPVKVDIGSGEGSSSSSSAPTRIVEPGGDCAGSSSNSSSVANASTSLPPHIRSFVGKENWQEFLSPLLKAKRFESEPNSNDTSCFKNDSSGVSSADSDVKSAASGSAVDASDSGECLGDNRAFANVMMSLDSKLANGHADNENNMNTEKEHSIRQSLIVNNNNKNEPNSDKSLCRELDTSCCKSAPDCEKGSDSQVSSSVNCQNNTNECHESVGNKAKSDISITPDAREAESKTKSPSLSGPESSSIASGGGNSAPSSTTDSNRATSNSTSPAPVTSQTLASASSSSSVDTAESTSAATATNTQEQEAGCSSSSDKADKEKGSIFHPDSSDDDDDDEDDYEESEEDDDDEEGDEDELMDDSEDDEVDEMDDKAEPIREMEEPGVDSGCTAVVALVRGSQIMVANAGDSRCILSRDGKAVELSFDHKPEDDPERTRIEAAGGTVTSDGRVNGGLNLSRAIGDHFYKRNQALPDKEQMITAHPDIQTGTLSDDDEFIVLACDGIWNFMTSQEVVDFVRVRLSDPGKRESPSKICEEMFDYCLAPNTMGDGTGCDNMTCVIVLLDKARKGLINTQPIVDISTSSNQVDAHPAEVDIISAAFSAAGKTSATAFSAAGKTSATAFSAAGKTSATAFSAAGKTSATADDDVSTMSKDDIAASAVSKRAVSDVESSSDVDSSSVHPEKRPKLDVSDDSEAEAKEAASSSDT